jgi:spermidine/putrescine transport system substrate-binding protein
MITRPLTTTLATLLMVLATGPAWCAGKLFLYNWTDYTSPKLIDKFEKETGIDVVLDTFDSNETLLAKLKAGGTGYDIVVPTHNFVPILVEEGLLQKINAKDLPGYDNIDPRWRSPWWDKDNQYSIPWQWGTTSFAVNTAVYDGDIDTYKVLFEPPPALQGQVGMFGTPDEIVSQALIYLGHKPCDAAEDPAIMQKVLDLLVAQKPYVKVYNSDGLLERLVAKDVAMQEIWNGYAMRSREQLPTLRYAFPKEGVLAFFDNLVVPKSASDRDNALRFIEFMLQPENAGLESNFAHYANGIVGSDKYMDPALLKAPELQPPPDRKVVFASACSEKAVRLIDKVWTRLRQ